jgi:hypothetical protein
VTEGVISLIAQVRAYVRRGAVVEMHLPNGVVLPEFPIAMLSLTEQMLWFVTAFDDHPHGQEVLGIRAGDDGQVLIDGHDAQVAIISEAWTNEQRATLEAWKESLKVIHFEFPVSPEPPGVVGYEG